MEHKIEKYLVGKYKFVNTTYQEKTYGFAERSFSKILHLFNSIIDFFNFITFDVVSKKLKVNIDNSGYYSFEFIDGNQFIELEIYITGNEYDIDIYNKNKKHVIQFNFINSEYEKSINIIDKKLLNLPEFIALNRKNMIDKILNL